MILKDWEQEICLVLLVFCTVQIIRRMWSLASEQYLFGVDVLKEAEEGASTLADTLDELETLPPEMSGTQLMRALKASLRRYTSPGTCRTPRTPSRRAWTPWGPGSRPTTR